MEKTVGHQRIESISGLVGVVSVVVGIVLSIFTFRESIKKDVQSRQTEAGKPFLEVRQRLYLDAVHSVAVLANPDTHSDEETKQAEKRFWELYWGELCLVETKGVEAAMIQFKTVWKDADSSLRDRHDAGIELAHVLRDSLLQSWDIRDESNVGEFNP